MEGGKAKFFALFGVPQGNKGFYCFQNNDFYKIVLMVNILQMNSVD